ncbi:hypothetical protein Lbir_0676 [Legionella birminghamensis]|uniref:DUF4124 domain-containing protein n=1 Tax=Legionella birminghamensis TaxID=28083 RepID=A0A378I9A0_9GAMM|nr:DUF4124 domain-containing protein [Legionella birminghamensis]KTC74886.1 hypothetical protein Lbir_0676 [Legionella birminghamensis]STX31788.1 Uncharacterised protein [Legionella birminghamensis]
MWKYGWGLLLFLTVNVVHADIYKWVDSNGNVHFTDKPHPGAEKIELPEAQTYSPATNQPAETEQIEKPADEEEKETYSYLAVSQPQNEATIRNNQGYVPIIIEIKPDLRKGDLLQILYDGEPLGDPQATTIFALNDVKRGSHTIAVQIVDAEGNVLNTSEAITIYMQRPRVGMGQVKPVPH